MKRSGLTLLFGGFVASVVCGVAVDPALAILPFRKEFEELYIVEEGGTAAQQKLAVAFENKESGKCFVCHANMEALGESKEYKKFVRNSYGKALSQFLNKDDFSYARRKAEPDKAKAEIQDAMKKVAAMKSNPDDPNSPTFGELISQGQLPSDGKPDPEDLKKATEMLKAEGKL